MSQAAEAAAGFGIDEALFSSICEAICPEHLIVQDTVRIGLRYPPNVRARALRICRAIADERLDAEVYGP